MNAPIKMVRSDAEEWPAGAPPGTYQFHDLQDGDLSGRALWFVCPKGCLHIARLWPLPPRENPQCGSWQLVGTEECPTLIGAPGRSSSYQAIGGCSWHGFITNGELIDA